MEQLVKKPYRHGNLPNAMRAAARGILDEGGSDLVKLREVARRVAVSPTAAYRHFESKDGLLASVAEEGFKALAFALEGASAGPDQFLTLGLAYVEFALQNRGLFRLMFGPILTGRANYPGLDEAATVAFSILDVSQAVEGRPSDDGGDAMAAWSLFHGIALLFMGGLIPEERAPSLAEKILRTARVKQEFV